MKVGGQSAARFARIRQNEIIHWFKRINEYLKKIDTELYVGINSIYVNKFKRYLNTYNLQKIKHIDSTEYTDISGIYQYLNKLKQNGIQNIY
jgi:peptide subunit release factor 1 (eRF1)